MIFIVKKSLKPVLKSKGGFGIVSFYLKNS